ncbi:hypothetical protein VE01_07649 [Pseudogymnoascus verrucosus]|uniref:Aminotransferase class I/classII large domain-containing protein n=1 Tax=Pseudogymnoascus verrucosus TaxID=342668 RepID=A0A1B8GHC7_9PEZI|nr:uncharacterized protein VE01_07649 [Pseudogymnoascus verrucosus]OBT95216.1 hypothetical protein VE01_07649 [Pseudogymnoascus verrucosus]
MVEITSIDLLRGWPSADLLPTSILEEASKRVLNDPALSTPSLSYGDEPGYEPLRESIATWLLQQYNTPWTVPERICISGGASQNLACILQVFTDPTYTRNVYLVAPTYHLVCRIFEDNGFVGRLRAIPEDDDGVDIAYLEASLVKHEMVSNGSDQKATKRPQVAQKHYKNIIYTVPTFSNPSGRTTSLDRRQQLVRLARKYDALIIADDIYDFIQWNSTDTNPPPPLIPRIVDIDHVLDGGPTTPFGNAISNASFSKILAPGLRTGWTEATPTFIRGLSQCGSSVSGGAPSQFVASVIAQTLRNGTLQDHIEKVLIPSYKRRYQATLCALERYLLPLGVVLEGKTKGPMQGGYFVYFLLPPCILAKEFVLRASHDEAVLIADGNMFEVHGDEDAVPARHGVRICFAWEQEDFLAEGLRRLGKVLASMLEPEPSVVNGRSAINGISIES